MPTVSVVIAAYNAAWCIGRALDSLLAQTRVPDEVLVCDDGSTDGTADLIERGYSAPIRVLRLPHKNASAARNEGLKIATGDWLAFMDADDRWFPEKLERQLDYIARHPEIRLVTSDGIYEKADEVIRESWLSDYFDPVTEMVGDLAPTVLERCYPLLSATMVERNAYHAIGGIDTHYTHCYDYDLWLGVLSRFPGGVMPDRLVGYFWSAGALSRNNEARNRDDLRLMRKIENGERADLRRRAAERAASLEYEIGLICLRGGRYEEARACMRRALAKGPPLRRAMAVAGAILPGWAAGPLMRSKWLKRGVARSREVRDVLLNRDGGSAA